MLGSTPRVSGDSPGRPICSSNGPTSSGPYSGRTGSPESVVNSASRSVDCLSSVAIRRSLSAASGGAKEGAGDHEPLDLARALVDLGDLGVAVVALGRELLRVAVAAEDLDRLARLAARDAAGEQLGLRALDGVRAAGVLQTRRAPDQRARRLDLRLHVGELVLDRL